MTPDTLVSCLMVTQPGADRLAFVERSIAAYARQTHAPTELVVVINPSGPAAEALAARVEALGRTDIRIVVPPGMLSLGALRNRGIAAARGDVLCQWDDDDLHHPERLARQLAAMRAAGRAACCLQDVMQYLAVPRQLFWTNWLMTPGQAHPGTLMADRRLDIRYPETGPDAVTGEDSVVLAAMLQRGQVHSLAGLPHLFVYVAHGGNLWPPEHHRMLVERLSLSCGLLRRREPQIRAGLSAFDFGPGPVALMGSNGTAFLLEREAG